MCCGSAKTDCVGFSCRSSATKTRRIPQADQCFISVSSPSTACPWRRHHDFLYHNPTGCQEVLCASASRTENQQAAGPDTRIAAATCQGEGERENRGPRCGHPVRGCARDSVQGYGAESRCRKCRRRGTTVWLRPGRSRARRTRPATEPQQPPERWHETPQTQRPFPLS